MGISVRLRFEVFKRDSFTCRYCGRQSPEVILELDHIIPSCEGGSDDLMNLATSCWDCNRGKSGRPLSEVTTGEDPHDRAIALLERERQLREYNEVLAQVSARVDKERKELIDYWPSRTSKADRSWLWNRLLEYPQEMIFNAMEVAIAAGKTAGFAYVNAVLKNQSAGQ